jgi:hypothetical protein
MPQKSLKRRVCEAKAMVMVVEKISFDETGADAVEDV